LCGHHSISHWRVFRRLSMNKKRSNRQERVCLKRLQQTERDRFKAGSPRSGGNNVVIVSKAERFAKRFPLLAAVAAWR
jgi:hypothetical protein